MFFVIKHFVYLYNANKTHKNMEGYIFEIKGFFKAYFVKRKLIGVLVLQEPDREVFGYAGINYETLEEEITLTNGKVLKKGTYVETEVNPICGKLINNFQDKK